MAFTINEFTVVGNLTRDVELRTSATGANYAYVTVAQNRKDKSGKESSDFIEVTIWRQAAEFASKYAHKGDCVCIKGNISSYRREENGKVRTEMKLNASQFNIVHSSRRREEGTYGGNSAYNVPRQQAPVPPTESSTLDITSDDLPF